MAQSFAFRSPLNDAGDVGHGQHTVIGQPGHAQVRRQGGKRIVANFGFRRADDGKQGRLARIRQSHQANFRD